MAINLVKGGKLDLSKEAPTLKNALIGLGWDSNVFDTGSAFDLDATAFALAANGKCASEQDVIFYGGPIKNADGTVDHTSHAIKYMGDNKTGDGDGDDEQIIVNLDNVPDNIDRIVFTVTIYDAEVRGQNFGQISNAYIRLVNNDNGEEICRYDLGEEFSIETAVVFAELYRYNGSWKFNAIGSGFQGGLAALCHQYGVETQ